MAKICNLKDERACALNGKYTINVQSNEGETMFAGLQALMEPGDFNAHLHRDGDYWCATVAANALESVDKLSERLAGVGLAHHHWVRLMVWDEERQLIALDRTYSPEGEMNEPIPG